MTKSETPARGRATRGPVAALAVAALAVAALALLSAPTASAQQPKQSKWVGTWSVAQFDPGPITEVLPQPGSDELQGLTVRNVVRTTIGGSAVRIRVANRFGELPVTFDDVRAALSRGGAATTGIARAVTFRGKSSVTIPVGAEVQSDPVNLKVGAGRDISVSLHTSKPTGTVSFGGSLQHATYISERGNFTTSADGAPFTKTARVWFYLAGVDVPETSSTKGAVVALGDSITAGSASTTDTWRGWVDLLAGRLARGKPKRGVLNAGIVGNSLHEDSPCFGQRGPRRLSRDALDLPGARTVILALGVNDLAQPNGPHDGPIGSCPAETRVSAADMIGLYQGLAKRVRARGMKIVAATITPFGASPLWTQATEAVRRRINAWILKAKDFDGVADFAKTVADPGDASRLNPSFDSGDGLHPNDAGHAAMARAIPKELP